MECPPPFDPTAPNGPPWKEPETSLQEFFTSPENENRKQQICDIGRRLWTREYVDGNGGNLSIRVGSDLALCTPTGVSKGFMRPEQLCLTDLDGEQKAGPLRRTSEIRMHLEIMKKQERAVACVHCHPPCATAFAACGIQPPNNVLPEFELFVGEVPIASYETPGTLEMALNVARHSEHTTILMASHGVVAWSPLSIEDAYFKVEILETYCRTIMAMRELRQPPHRFTALQLKALLDTKEKLGVPDPRIGKAVESLHPKEDGFFGEK